jgi:hypothetical protein
MSRRTLRSIFTVLLYAGVGVFLYPYLTGHLTSALIFLVVGIGLAVLCGVLRCCFAEGDCTEREYMPHNSTAEPRHPHPRVTSGP